MERDQFLSGILQELEWEKSLCHLGQKSPKQQKNPFGVILIQRFLGQRSPKPQIDFGLTLIQRFLDYKTPGRVLQDPWTGTTCMLYATT